MLTRLLPCSSVNCRLIELCASGQSGIAARLLGLVGLGRQEGGGIIVIEGLPVPRTSDGTLTAIR